MSNPYPDLGKRCLFIHAFLCKKAFFLKLGSVLLLSCVLGSVSSFAGKLDYKVSWLGNTYDGSRGDLFDGEHVPNRVHDVFVEGNHVFTASLVDEGGYDICQYDLNGNNLTAAFYTRGWGQFAGHAITANPQYVYFGSKRSHVRGQDDTTTWPPSGKVWYGIDRRLRSDIQKEASFAGGKGNSAVTLKQNFLVIHEVDEGVEAHIKGVHTTATRLYVSCPYDNRIRVYHASSMAPRGGESWTMTDPAELTMDNHGKLWIIEEGTNKVHCYNPATRARVRTITLPAGSVAEDVAIDEKGWLLITDSSPLQVIHKYSNLRGNPKAEGYFGVSNGIYGGNAGEVAPLKFNRPVGVGVSDDGDVFVGNNGNGASLEAYQGNSLRWKRECVFYVDVACVDPVSEQIYGVGERFSVDYSKSDGQEAVYAATTHYRFNTDDPRSQARRGREVKSISNGVWMRQIHGKRFMFGNNNRGAHLEVYRFTEGEYAVPSGFFSKKKQDVRTWSPKGQPESGEWIWRDSSGNGRFDRNEYVSNGGEDLDDRHGGWYVDMEGNIWQTVTGSSFKGVRKFPVGAALDGKGNPVWSYSTMETFAMPEEFTDLRRIRYDEENDVMYFSGIDADNRNEHWKAAGPVYACYDNWSIDPVLRWKIVVPYAEGVTGRHQTDEPISMDVEGDYLFLAYNRNRKTNPLNIRFGHIKVYRVEDGAYVGYIEPPTDWQEVGLFDIHESINVHLRSDGEYIILAEEDYKGKVMMYRWRPTQNLSLESGASARQSSIWGGYGAERAIDGKTSGKLSDGSISVTNKDTRAWWEVDLGQEQLIESVKIWNRADGVSSRLVNYRVIVYDGLGKIVFNQLQEDYPNLRSTITVGNVIGRRVRIRLEGTNFLQLAEVQVMGHAIQNLTLESGAWANQSSVWNRYGADRAIDGNTDGDFGNGSVTATNREAQAWLSIDLRAEKQIAAVDIWNRTDAVPGRLKDYRVIIRNAASKIVFNELQTDYPDPKSRISVGSVSGRYVTVRLTGTNFLSLAEVQVWGSDTTIEPGLSAEYYDFTTGLSRLPSLRTRIPSITRIED